MTIDSFGIIKNTLRTSSGTNVSIESPNPETIFLSDIAHALSRTTRFGGHIVVDHYGCNAQQHCCVNLGIALEYSKAELKAVLLHDAAEAYLGDVIRPLKVNLPLYHEYELRFEAVLAEKFDVSFNSFANQIKFVDNVLLMKEKALLLKNSQTFTFNDESKYQLPANIDWVFKPFEYTPSKATREFLNLALELGIQ